jgi:hypothetical protein
MAAYVIDSRLFRDQFSTEASRRIFSDENTVQKWLDVEAALARVEAKLGIIPQEAANEISRKAKVELFDLDEMKKEMDRTSHPIVPLLRGLKKVCDREAGEYVHWGATTQDIIDTGTVLQLREALDEIEATTRQLLGKVADLAENISQRSWLDAPTASMLSLSHSVSRRPNGWPNSAAILNASARCGDGSWSASSREPSVRSPLSGLRATTFNEV